MEIALVLGLIGLLLVGILRALVSRSFWLVAAGAAFVGSALTGWEGLTVLGLLALVPVYLFRPSAPPARPIPPYAKDSWGRSVVSPHFNKPPGPGTNYR